MDCAAESIIYLQFKFLPIDDHGGDLLIHEDEYGGDQGWHDGEEHCVPWVVARVQADQPASLLCAHDHMTIDRGHALKGGRLEHHFKLR